MKSADVIETFARTGIDVDALSAVARHVEALVDADDLRVLAEEAMREALARDRAVFDAKWCDFWKCARCGYGDHSGGYALSGSPCGCCGAPNDALYRTGYTRAR